MSKVVINDATFTPVFCGECKTLEVTTWATGDDEPKVIYICPVCGRRYAVAPVAMKLVVFPIESGEDFEDDSA